eukprot:GHUV01020850.1.p3 GENE.GHUV01020850.1~~GHUV01020850.1.p3  ORF type:complete len:111 (-),score=30.36 GHUV01020850.1:575-907(-)
MYGREDRQRERASSMSQLHHGKQFNVGLLLLREHLDLADTKSQLQQHRPGQAKPSMSWQQLEIQACFCDGGGLPPATTLYKQKAANAVDKASSMPEGTGATLAATRCHIS